MVKESINVEDVCNLLNELLKDDAEFVHNFVSNRVDCNVKIACHPAVQVQENENGFRVGLLGFLNGLFGVYDDGFGPICMVTMNQKIVRFQPTPKDRFEEVFMIEMREGRVKKGGVNSEPTTVKPDIEPGGQGITLADAELRSIKDDLYNDAANCPVVDSYMGISLDKFSREDLEKMISLLTDR